MLILGAGGHAKELLQILERQGQTTRLSFFDNINGATVLFDRFKIITSFEEAKTLLATDPFYAIGIGGTVNRYKLSNRIAELGGTLNSIICPTALISTFEVHLETGLNIMSHVFISNSVHIGIGTLVNYGVNIHHDVTIGNYCELSPKCQLLGGVEIGDYSSIGAGAIILPKVKIGKNVYIGAGAVVTKNLGDNCVAVGTPAKIIKELAPLAV